MSKDDNIVLNTVSQKIYAHICNDPYLYDNARPFDFTLVYRTGDVFTYNGKYYQVG